MVDTGALYIGTTFKGALKATMGAPRPTQREADRTYLYVRTYHTYMERISHFFVRYTLKNSVQFYLES